MSMIVRMISAFFWSILFVVPSLAAQPNSIQKSELQSLVTDLNNAAAHKNMAMIVANMPDRLYKEMAKRLHTTEDELKQSLAKQIQAQFANLSADAYHLDEKNIEYKETKNGLFYALVPTRIETEKAVVEYTTLAIFDNTKWHIIYGGQKTIQNPVFQEIYPYFHDVNFPKEVVHEK